MVTSRRKEESLSRAKTADGDSRQCRWRQLKECQNTRWKTISKSHRTPSDAVKWDLALYLRQSGELLGLVFIWRCPRVGSQFPVGENSRKTWTELWLWAHKGMVYELQFLKWTTAALQKWRIKARTPTGWGDVSVPHLNWWLVATLQGRAGRDLFVCQRGLHSHSCWTFIEF